MASSGLFPSATLDKRPQRVRTHRAYGTGVRVSTRDWATANRELETDYDHSNRAPCLEFPRRHPSAGSDAWRVDRSGSSQQHQRWDAGRRRNGGRRQQRVGCLWAVVGLRAGGGAATVAGNLGRVALRGSRLPRVAGRALARRRGLAAFAARFHRCRAGRRAPLSNISEGFLTNFLNPAIATLLSGRRAAVRAAPAPPWRAACCC